MNSRVGEEDEMEYEQDEEDDDDDNIEEEGEEGDYRRYPEDRPGSR